MIQRRQTIFLALAALIAFVANLFPFASYQAQGMEQAVVFRTTGLFLADGTVVEEASPKVPFLAVLVVLGLALLVSIFFYRDRPRQVRIVRGTYLVALGAIAFAVITDRSVQVWLAARGPVEVSYGVAFFAPFAVLVLAFLAERGIRADEALVRAMDRLR